MQIDLKARAVHIDDELREHVERRFRKIARQVSDLARLEMEFSIEGNPAKHDAHVAEATLHLKGCVLRATAHGRDPRHAMHLCEDELSRQVKRQREKRRGRRKVGTPSIRHQGIADGMDGAAPAM